MKTAVALLVLTVAVGHRAEAQGVNSPPPFMQLQQFLGLTDDQVNSIVQTNADYNQYVSDQSFRIFQLQVEYSSELIKDNPDPIAVGQPIVAIQVICRGLKAHATTAQQKNVSVLTDGQRTKLNTLSEALDLLPTISQGVQGNLMGTWAVPPTGFTASAPGTSLISTDTNGVPGCSLLLQNPTITNLIFLPSSPVETGIKAQRPRL